jgi:chromosome segregation ATPase
VEDALHERESVKAELESRTAALFKRDEMIQAADLEADGLREEVRDRERRVSAMEQQNEALRDEVSLKDSEIRRRDEAVTGLERRVEQLSEQVEQLNVDLVRKGEQLEASQRENKELTDAWANATGEMELHRAKFLESFGHIQLTQSVLAELKPMLDSLESTLNTDDDDVDPALPTSPEEAVSESPSD